MANPIKRPDGRYELKFTVNGKRYTVYGKKKSECKDKETAKRAELAAGAYITKENITIDQYFDRWLDTKRAEIEGSTIRSYKNRYKAISTTPIDSAGTPFGKLKLQKIETQNVRDLQKALLPGRTTNTVNQSVTLLRSVLQTAVNERLISWNPAAPVKGLKRTEEAARDTIHKPLTREDTAKFLKAAETSHYKNLYVFLLNTGCRIGEAGALYRTDINEKGMQISRTLTQTENSNVIIGDDTKTEAGRRYIPLSAEARKAIQAQQEQNEALYGNVIGIKQPIFRAPHGGFLVPSTVSRDMTRICKKAGLEKITVHAFRATFATRCVESGMSPKTLQEIMGHTNIRMTMDLYAHAMDETKEKQLSAVNFL